MSGRALAYLTDSTVRMATRKYGKVRPGQAIGSLLGARLEGCLFSLMIGGFRPILTQGTPLWVPFIPEAAVWPRDRLKQPRHHFFYAN